MINHGRDLDWIADKSLQMSRMMNEELGITLQIRSSLCLLESVRPYNLSMFEYIVLCHKQCQEMPGRVGCCIHSALWYIQGDFRVHLYTLT